MELATIVAMIGVVLGVLLRAYFPYLKAMKEAEQAGEEISFKPKYVASTLFSLLVTSISVLYALAAFQVPEVTSAQGMIFLLTFGLSYGYAFTGGINLVLDR
jgi:heme/copper-type cytochrome/quinol oxidase subunit 3